MEIRGEVIGEKDAVGGEGKGERESELKLKPMPSLSLRFDVALPA